MWLTKHFLAHKMWYQWHEDMLNEEKCQLLHHKMDAFLGKHLSAILLPPLCSLHPLWPRVHHWLTDGISYLLGPLQKNDRITDLTTMLEHSNHKLANFHHDQLVQMLAAEVEHGWQLILPCSCRTRSMSRARSTYIRPDTMSVWLSSTWPHSLYCQLPHVPPQ